MKLSIIQKYDIFYQTKPEILKYKTKPGETSILTRGKEWLSNVPTP